MTADEAKEQLVADCDALHIDDVHIIRRTAKNFDDALLRGGNVESAYNAVNIDLQEMAGINLA